MGDKLPYRAEYAKSGRSACKGCKQPIDQSTVRLAIMVQSPFFDGMQPNWHHVRCFFSRTRVKNVDDIAHFQNLRWADQEDIRGKIASSLGVPVAPVAPSAGKKKGKRKAAANADPSLPPDLGDYTVEYAKSSRSKCRLCEVNIPKDEVRISKKDYEGEVAKKYGPVEQWHHVDCFVRARSELGYVASGASLPGFFTLSPDDQNTLKKKIPALKRDVTEVDAPTKAPKVAKVEDDGGLVALMKEQNEKLFAIRDKLLEIPKKDVIHLLESNHQAIPEGIDRILDRLADNMTFGRLKPCKKCKGQLVFQSGVGYRCLGDLTEWTKCGEIYDKPPRTDFKVPKDLQSDYSALKKYKCVKGDRAFTKAAKVEEAGPSTSNGVANGTSKKLPLSGVEFLVHKTDADTNEVKKSITELGGTLNKTFKDSLGAVVSVASELQRKKQLKAIVQAQEADIPIISDDFFTAISSSSTREDVIKVFKEKTISTWGKDIDSKLAYDTVDGGKSVYRSKSAAAVSTAKSIFKSEMGVQKMTVKDGLIVDPDSQLVKKAHVYRAKNDYSGDGAYSTVLSLTDIQAQKNSYYKLQVLEADKGNRFWLFRSWGRIGTTQGGNKTEEYSTLREATSMFEALFEEKTGNSWHSRHHFVKIPSKMMMLEVVHGQDDTSVKLQGDLNSKLPKPVQDLMCLIFDIEAMKKTMLEFELDLNKMPLGKLSQKQITSAFSLLTELQKLRKDSANRSHLIDRSNRFYTLVPHDFGIQNPPILDNDELINQKIEMLNSLMDIEIAYNLLSSSTDTTDSPIDAHYKKLKTDISVLDRTSDEFKNIETYLKNTHAKTHRNYSLDIEEVYKVKREGEESRFKPFTKLPNRQLLWHGSRVTNFAGILSQGLRIAPPEAPVTGYMFGKGIYFADMVSKSANYCMTSSQNNTGLLLLCEVALGQMQELKMAQDVKKPPKGFHSVKGVGTTMPDPAQVGQTPTGAIIPFGPSKPNKVPGASLLYNDIYINENLSPTVKDLFWKARVRGKLLDYEFAWVKNGQVYMKQRTGAPLLKISTEDDLPPAPRTTRLSGQRNTNTNARRGSSDLVPDKGISPAVPRSPRFILERASPNLVPEKSKSNAVPGKAVDVPLTLKNPKAVESESGCPVPESRCDQVISADEDCDETPEKKEAVDFCLRNTRSKIVTQSIDKN